MGEREELLGNLKQLVELDRAFGVEFMPRLAAPAAAKAAPTVKPLVPAPAPVPRPVKPAASAPAAPDTGHRTPDTGRSPADVGPVPVAPVPTGLPAADLATIAAEVSACTRCKLCSSRTNTVPGEGNPGPELLFVGEGPGADEDAQGRPFVGAAGQLLTKMIQAMGLARSDVFIANVLKCRPPGNRTPEPDEIAACMPFLRQQIAVLKPKLICTLGNTPLRALMGDDALGITRMRGKKLSFAGITLIPTFHPSYLLRNPEAKKPCWEDLQTVLKELGRTLPKR
jgi:DNA polymerase